MLVTKKFLVYFAIRSIYVPMIVRSPKNALTYTTCRYIFIKCDTNKLNIYNKQQHLVLRFYYILRTLKFVFTIGNIFRNETRFYCVLKQKEK